MPYLYIFSLWEDTKYLEHHVCNFTVHMNSFSVLNLENDVPTKTKHVFSSVCGCGVKCQSQCAVLWCHNIFVYCHKCIVTIYFNLGLGRLGLGGLGDSS